ncbi:MAG TPA: hypothetical protein PLK41_08720 [Defluviitoga tunisiensis]|nr:hypothetical protein [Defluviitoga tunisiensis]HPP11056.1 hypothetical protein [Defluviitoga tunisiensis]
MKTEELRKLVEGIPCIKEIENEIEGLRTLAPFYSEISEHEEATSYVREFVGRLTRLRNIKRKLIEFYSNYYSSFK